MKPWRVPYPKFGAGPGLERVGALAAHLGVDLAGFSAAGVGVVGSNGKGSTAAMCAGLLLQNAGPVGLFTSPHLFALNERFKIDGQDISDDELQHHWERATRAVDALALRNAMGGFEFLSIIAADWFAARGCAHVVWEAGIGGRLDPVRLIRASRLALTSLDLEHTGLLGDTLAAIARDKLDAAPPGAKVFAPEALAFMRDELLSHCTGRDLEVSFVNTLSVAAFDLPLAGAHQRENAALALALARDIAPVSEVAAQAGFDAVYWPGRLEVLERAPLTVIDVGHTPDAIRVALQGFATLRGDLDAILVCGVSEDKAVDQIIGMLAPHFARIICCAARHKGAAVERIAASAAAAHPGADLVVAESVQTARQAARRLAGAEGAILVAGGLFLAAEFRALHFGQDPAHIAFL